METMVLLGSEQVQSAGNAMRSAGESMQGAARNLEGTLETFTRNFTDQLDRLEQVLEKHATRMEAIATVQEEFQLGTYSLGGRSGG